MLSKKGELRRDEACLDFGGKDVSGQICALKFDKNEARQATNITVRII